MRQVKPQTKDRYMSYEETFEHDGFTIRLTPDECGESPAQYGDMDRFLVGFHRDFSVQYADKSDGRYGDDAPVIKSKDDAFWYLPEGYEPEDAQEEADAGHVPGWRVFQLNAYIHSGVALSLGEFGCPWDSGQVGWVFVKEEHGWGEIDGKLVTVTHEQIAQWLVDGWNQYLSGDVWHFSIEDSDGEILDSCGGIYGMEDALEAAKNDSALSGGPDTKEVAVKILHTDGSWAQATGEVPLWVGRSHAGAWLMEHSCGEHGWRGVEEIIVSAAKAAKESAA
jgi:hypothetical protein